SAGEAILRAGASMEPAVFAILLTMGIRDLAIQERLRRTQHSTGPPYSENPLGVHPVSRITKLIEGGGAEAWQQKAGPMYKYRHQRSFRKGRSIAVERFRFIPTPSRYEETG